MIYKYFCGCGREAQYLVPTHGEWYWCCGKYGCDNVITTIAANTCDNVDIKVSNNTNGDKTNE